MTPQELQDDLDRVKARLIEKIPEGGHVPLEIKRIDEMLERIPAKDILDAMTADQPIRRLTDHMKALADASLHNDIKKMLRRDRAIRVMKMCIDALLIVTAVALILTSL